MIKDVCVNYIFFVLQPLPLFELSRARDRRSGDCISLSNCSADHKVLAVRPAGQPAAEGGKLPVCIIRESWADDLRTLV